jgi:hypothetical protein
VAAGTAGTATRDRRPAEPARVLYLLVGRLASG